MQSNRYASWGLLLSGLTLPIATAVHNILAAVLALTTPLFADKRRSLRQSLVLKSIPLLLILIGWILIAQIWGAPHYSFELLIPLWKYRKLLWIFLLLPFFNKRKYARIFINGFIIACSLTAWLLMLQYYHIHIPGLAYLKGGIFKNYLETSVCLAFGAFIQILWLHQFSSLWKKCLTAINILLFSFAIMIIPGRSGYLCLWLLSFIYIFQYWKARTIIAFLGLLFLTPLIIYFNAPVVHERVDQIIWEWQHYQSDTPQKTSLGLRLEFLHHSVELIRQKPWLGYGVGHFKTAYKTQTSAAEQTITDNAHNEFAMLAVQSGIPALIFFSLFMLCLWLDSNKLPLFEQSLLRGLLLCMLVGCLINSWLHDTMEGHWFAWVVALCLSCHPAYIRRT